MNAGALERPVEVRTEGTCAMASEEAGALGEARFEDVESADKPINPSSIFRSH